MRQAIKVNSNGESVKLTLGEALQSVVKADNETMTRFMNLNKAIKTNNSSLYEIAYFMEQIDKNKDSIVYGYKTTAEMVESFWGYKKSSTSKMLAVSRNFLECMHDGEIRSKFHDLYDSGYDVPMSCLYELLLDKDTMRYRCKELVDFYHQFPLDEMKQTEFRELKSTANSLVKKGLPLTIENDETLKLVTDSMSGKQEEEKQETKSKEKRESEKQDNKEVDSIETFKLYLGTISTILNDEKNEKKKEAMLKMFDDVLKMHKSK